MPVKRQDPVVLFWKHVEKTTTCWNWTGATMWKGYGVFGIAPERRHLRAHRYAWEIAHGTIPRGLFVLHRCDNRRCVRPEHLFLGTHDDNMRDKMQKGGRIDARGANNYNAKLTDAHVRRLREMSRRGVLHKNIATMFGVTRAAVSYAARGDTWSHVK